MPVATKITEFNLIDQVIELYNDGKTTYEIAKILTREAKGKYRISQSAVARFLQSIRQARSNQTRQIVHEFIKTTVPADLDSINEVQMWLMRQFRSHDVLTREGVSRSINQYISQDMFDELRKVFPAKPLELRKKSEIGMKILKVIDLKLKYSGILEKPDKQIYDDSEDPVDLNEFRIDKKEKKKEKPHLKEVSAGE